MSFCEGSVNVKELINFWTETVYIRFEGDIKLVTKFLGDCSLATPVQIMLETCLTLPGHTPILCVIHRIVRNSVHWSLRYPHRNYVTSINPVHAQTLHQADLRPV